VHLCTARVETLESDGTADGVSDVSTVFVCHLKHLSFLTKTEVLRRAMAFTLWALLEAALLALNSVCILHEQRFLAKFGWASDNSRGFGEQPGVKSQILNIIHSTRTVMRIPLIFINAMVICWKLVLG